MLVPPLELAAGNQEGPVKITACVLGIARPDKPGYSLPAGTVRSSTLWLVRVTFASIYTEEDDCQSP